MRQPLHDDHHIGPDPTVPMHRTNASTTAITAATVVLSNDENSKKKRQMPEQPHRFSTILVARSSNTRPTGRSL